MIRSSNLRAAGAIAPALLFLAIPQVVQAQLTFTGSQATAVVEVGQQNTNSWSPFFNDTDQSTALHSTTESASGNYIGSDDNGQPMGYSGSGAATLGNHLLGNGYEADFETDGISNFIDGNGGFFDPGVHGAVSADELFTVGSTGTFTLSASGVITHQVDSGLGGAFSFTGFLHDFTTGTVTNFNVASASRSLTNFSQQVQLNAGDSCELTWFDLSYGFAANSGLPSTTESGMSGSVKLEGEPVPEPCTIAAMACGAATLVRRRKKA